MITFDKALSIVNNQITKFKLNTENVDIFNCLGRVLAEDIKCDRDLPPFNRVAMDGYACKSSDIFNKLEVVDFVAAGHSPSKTIEKGQCSKVMTGCMLPKGADMVFKIELSKDLGNNYVEFTGNEKDAKAKNYCPMGEDNKEGDLIIEKGTLLHSGHVGIIASLGINKPLVYKAPTVGIIATGDEIVEPEIKPENHQIRNTNSYLLYSQCKKIGCNPIYFGIAKDIKEDINKIFNNAIEKCDVVLMTGGVSMGDFDLVPDIMKMNNFEILFDKVKVKPGKPTTLSVSENKVCFGMPGNPVSTFMIFEVIVKLFLQKIMGQKDEIITFKLPLAKEISRKKSSRKQWIPVSFNNQGEVVPLPYHGSGHFTSLAQAKGIISIPEGVSKISKGQLVDVRQI